MIIAATSIIVFILDQLVKHSIQQHFVPGQSLTVIDGFFSLTYVQNPGAAFGMFAYQMPFLIGITLAVIAAILFFYRQIPPDLLLRLGVGLLLGGALGNLLDRIRFGYVIDYLDFYLSPELAWPTFNLADCAIIGGVCLIVLRVWQTARTEERVR